MYYLVYYTLSYCGRSMKSRGSALRTKARSARFRSRSAMRLSCSALGLRGGGGECAKKRTAGSLEQSRDLALRTARSMPTPNGARVPVCVCGRGPGTMRCGECGPLHPSERRPPTTPPAPCLRARIEAAAPWPRRREPVVRGGAYAEPCPNMRWTSVTHARAAAPR